MLTNGLTTTLGLGFSGIGMWEGIIIALLGVLIFGKRLPEVGRSIGKGIVEFKKGLAGIEDDIDTSAKQPPRIEKHTTSSVDAGATSEKAGTGNHNG
jgi:sec-independent protein translocase protein TatA